jgi:hypothetical protein
MCLYRQVDVSGFPTREGLVRLYAEGVRERGYYLATADASQQCLQVAHQRRLRSQPSEQIILKTCIEILANRLFVL